MVTPKKPASSQRKTVVGISSSSAPGGGGHDPLAPKSIIMDRSKLKSGGKKGQLGKDALFSFDQRNLDVFALSTGRGGRGHHAGPRATRPPKLSSSSVPAESAAPKGTEGATANTAGKGDAADTARMISPAPPVRASATEVPSSNNINSKHHAGANSCCWSLRSVVKYSSVALRGVSPGGG